MNNKYSRKMLRKLAQTRYSKRTMSRAVMVAWVTVLRMHLSTALCLIVGDRGPRLDFLAQTAIPILLYFATPALKRAVQPCEETAYGMVTYFVKEYTEEKMKVWKKLAVVVPSLYLIALLQFVEVTSAVLSVWIVQNLVYCFVVDFVEERKYAGMCEKVKQYVKDRRERARTTIIETPVVVADHFPIPSTPPPPSPSPSSPGYGNDRDPEPDPDLIMSGPAVPKPQEPKPLPPPPVPPRPMTFRRRSRMITAKRILQAFFKKKKWHNPA